MDSSMDTEDLLSMSLDQMIASKPKKKFDGGGGGRGGGGGGKARTTGRASRQRQSQPYNRQSAPAHSVGGGASNNRVYVGNLAWTVTWKELKDLMSTCGPCKADVGVGPDGRSKVSERERDPQRERRKGGRPVSGEHVGSCSLAGDIAK